MNPYKPQSPGAPGARPGAGSGGAPGGRPPFSPKKRFPKPPPGRSGPPPGHHHGGAHNGPPRPQGPYADLPPALEGPWRKMDRFELFCALHLGITPDDRYKPQGMLDLPRRFKMPLHIVRQALYVYGLLPEQVAASGFRLSVYQDDIRVTPDGVSRTEQARAMFDDFLAKSPRARDWERCVRAELEAREAERRRRFEPPQGAYITAPKTPDPTPAPVPEEPPAEPQTFVFSSRPPPKGAVRRRVLRSDAGASSSGAIPAAPDAPISPENVELDETLFNDDGSTPMPWSAAADAPEPEAAKATRRVRKRAVEEDDLDLPLPMGTAPDPVPLPPQLKAPRRLR